MPLPEELNAFWSRTPEPADTRTLNRLNASFRLWSRYYGFLKIIKGRYEEADEVFLEAMRRQQEAVERAIAAGVSSHPVTPEEWDECLRVAAITERLHLELESFYVFSKILADRMADTFAFFFGFNWERLGSTHSQLDTSLGSRCRKLALTIEPKELPTLLSEVHERIVRYRTTDIEHVSEPGLMHATTFHMTDGKARIAPNVVCPIDPEEAGRKYSAKRTEVPDELLPLIDAYGAALLRFFETNVHKSVAARVPADA